MKLCPLVVVGASLALVVLSTAPAARAQEEAPVAEQAITEPLAETTSFSMINDSVDGKFFNAATTHQAAGNPNRLIIGFNSGLDMRTFKYNDFRASTAAFYGGQAMDTLSVRISAPTGCYIASITYAQGGTGSVVRTGKAAGDVNFVIANRAEDGASFSTNPTLTRTFAVPGQRASVRMSVTVGLFAFSTPQLGSAAVGITSASISVNLAPVDEFAAPLSCPVPLLP
jgi:hypothetical protein